MRAFFKKIVMQTKGKKVTYFNIKNEIEQFVESSGVEKGLLVVQSPHTTCSVIFEEMVHDYDFNGYEYLQVDLNKSLNKLFPPQETEGEYYRYPGPKHMAFAQQGEDDTYIKDPGLLLNCPAHLKGSLLGASESFVVWDGKVQTGEYGDVYFVDWDYNRPRKRNCYLMLIGE